MPVNYAKNFAASEGPDAPVGFQRVGRIIFKLVWPDLILFVGIYSTLNVLYRLALSKEEQALFEKMVRNCAINSYLIPVSFVVGFYFWTAIWRIWSQYKTIPSLDALALHVSTNIYGQKDDITGKIIGRTVMRYCCLSLVLTFMEVSSNVKRRFSTLGHLVEAGLLLENEKEVIEHLNRSDSDIEKHWLPVVWACSIITRTRKEGNKVDSFGSRSIIDELNKFRAACVAFSSQFWIRISLASSQVAKLVMYVYIFGSAIESQTLISDGNNNKTTESAYREVALTFPVFTALQVLFYTGLLKLADLLANPDSDDTDILELNRVLNRSLKVPLSFRPQMQSSRENLAPQHKWEELFDGDISSSLTIKENKEHYFSHLTSKIPPQYSRDKNSSFHGKSSLDITDSVDGDGDRQFLGNASVSYSATNPDFIVKRSWGLNYGRKLTDETKNKTPKRETTPKKDCKNYCSKCKTKIENT